MEETNRGSCKFRDRQYTTFFLMWVSYDQGVYKVRCAHLVSKQNATRMLLLFVTQWLQTLTQLISADTETIRNK